MSLPALPDAIPDLPLHDYVLADADARGDRPALVDGVTGRTLTYRALAQQACGLASGLVARGITPGQVIAILAPNSPEYAVVFHGVSRSGAILTTINPSYTVEEVTYQLADSTAVLLLTTTALLERARAAVAATGRPIDLVTLDAGTDVPSLASLSLDREPPAVSIAADDVVVLPYSSGTTGLSKGVMLTHRNLVANLVQIDLVETHDFQALLGVLPFFHIYGMVVIMNHGLKRGATIVTLPRFDLEAVLAILQRWPIATAHVVPPVALAFAKHPALDGADLSSLRWLFSGAAPLGRELTAAVEARLPIRVRQGYGMTEASPVTHYTPPGDERAGTVGRAVPFTDVRLVDPDSGHDVAPGTAGEVWVRGPQVMKGYWRNPEATARTVDDEGWLHTGDVGRVDADGYLEIVDRVKELIKVKGFQVAPAELEALLVTHPAIADAAVIGVPDADAGEVPKAFVVTRAPLSEEDVCGFVAGHVASYKQIRLVAFVAQIPKSPSGKILRRLLRDA